MKKIAVVGAGHIGSTIAALLSGSGDYEVQVIDRDQEVAGPALDLLAEFEPGIRAVLQLQGKLAEPSVQLQSAMSQPYRLSQTFAVR